MIFTSETSENIKISLLPHSAPQQKRLCGDKHWKTWDSGAPVLWNRGRAFNKNGQSEERRVDVSENPQNHLGERVSLRHVPSPESQSGTHFPSTSPLLFLSSPSHPEESEATASKWRKRWVLMESQLHTFCSDLRYACWAGKKTAYWLKSEVLIKYIGPEV